MDMNVRDLWADDPLAIREIEGGGLTLSGYAVRYDSPSLPMSAMQIAEPASRSAFGRFGVRQFREVVRPGALKKALSESPDITLRYQHNMNTPPLGRTTSGTLRLSSDDSGLVVENDLPDNAWGHQMRDAVNRRDITGMSIRFGAVKELWSPPEDSGGIPVRNIIEMRLGPELSLVDFPAFPSTSAAIRALAEELDVEPEAIETAFAVLKEPDARLTPEQKDLLISAVNARTDDPVIETKVVSKQAEMRERLAAIAR